MKYTKLEKDAALKVIQGTSLKDRLNGWTYRQLVAAFGLPTFTNGSGDDKIQKEWVFQRDDGEVFTLYDWKTYDVNYTTNYLSTWNVGGKTYAGEFVTDLMKQLKKKN